MPMSPADGRQGHIRPLVREFLLADRQMADLGPSVSVFGSARIGRHHPDYRLAEDIASALSAAGLAVVCGGGPGLMEAVNKGAARGPGASVGLNIHLPATENRPNPHQQVSLRFSQLVTRKAMFLRHARAFVVLPGGFGTLDELGDCLTLIQTGKAPRVPVILVRGAFWNGLLAWFSDTLLAEGLVSEADLSLCTVCETAAEVLAAVGEPA